MGRISYISLLIDDLVIIFLELLFEWSIVKQVESLFQFWNALESYVIHHNIFTGGLFCNSYHASNLIEYRNWAVHISDESGLEWRFNDLLCEIHKSDFLDGVFNRLVAYHMEQKGAKCLGQPNRESIFKILVVFLISKVTLQNKGKEHDLNGVKLAC